MVHLMSECLVFHDISRQAQNFAAVHQRDEHFQTHFERRQIFCVEVSEHIAQVVINIVAYFFH